ncbi:MAG: 23S rRNA (adenine(2030)-N(6))-methyltransferase RlmJ [Treponema sp.]|jgi:23S rRNA (adenine2030-N6)-methyltransferase|nr:23S rRNA (adenine(2030)-N(6))-methyltransferase RlmJ [Treponema sp.]
MLSYRHAFHAGNAADVVKHMALVFCLEYLGQKEKPYLAVDTHAGAGSYSLLEGYAAKNREWEGGIRRLLDQGNLPGRAFPPLIARYVELVQEAQPAAHASGPGLAAAPGRAALADTAAVSGAAAPGGAAGAGGGLRRYPGSPALMQKLLRPRDRAVCFELHPADFAALQDGFGADPRFRLRREDGLGGLKALLPPPSRRGCVFIDPSYEVKDDYRTLPLVLAEALRRFPSGLYIIWYPLLGQDGGRPAGGRGLGERLRALYAGNRCGFELRTSQRPASPGDALSGGMYGSGLVIYNPPWPLRSALEESLPLLASALGGATGDWDMWWEEAASPQ